MQESDRKSQSVNNAPSPKQCKICGRMAQYEELEGSEFYPTIESAERDCHWQYYCLDHIPLLVVGRIGSRGRIG